MLPERLGELRKKYGYTKKNLGAYLEMTPEGYGYYESGIRNPSPDTIAKLASFYSVTTDYLLGLTDDPSPYKKKTDTPQEVSEQEIMYALCGENIEAVSEVLNDVRNYARFIIQQHKIKDNSNQPDEPG